MTNILKCILLKEKRLYFASNSVEVCSGGFNWQWLGHKQKINHYLHWKWPSSLTYMSHQTPNVLTTNQALRKIYFQSCVFQSNFITKQLTKIYFSSAFQLFFDWWGMKIKIYLQLNQYIDIFNPQLPVSKLKSQIIIKLRKIFKKILSPSPKLSVLVRQTGRNFEHCYYINKKHNIYNN